MSIDLRTGDTVWLLKNGKPPEFAPLHKNIKAEIIIVGAGISGALLAYTLCKMGKEVVLLDHREIGSGSTLASTALLSYETDIMLADMIDDIGDKKAMRVFEAGREALDYIESITRELEDDCDFIRRPSIYFASKKSDLKIIEKEYETRRRNGFELQFLNSSAFSGLFSFSSPGALCTRDMAEVDPAKLTRALVKKASMLGLEVYNHTLINEYKYDKVTRTTLLTTDAGYKAEANCVIFATGYETQEFLKQKKVKLNSSFAIASQPVAGFNGWYQRADLWESARPYLYMRTTADNRIIIGGEDVPFLNEEKRDRLLPEKAAILKKKFEEKFPEIPFEMAAAWAGTFAESDDGLPYIGAHKDYPGAYFALGYGGNGITFAAMACMIIPDLIAGKKNTDSDIFRFGR